jgi:hypothetical protein
MISEFDTSLGIRLDYEACLAYLAVPPIGAILLLILERNSDFVRYVATFQQNRGPHGHMTRSYMRAGADRISDSTRGSQACCLQRCS